MNVAKRVISMETSSLKDMSGRGPECVSCSVVNVSGIIGNMDKERESMDADGIPDKGKNRDENCGVLNGCRRQ